MVLILCSIVIGFIIVSPILYALSMSLMTADRIFQQPPKLLPNKFYFANYKEMLHTAPLFQFIFNSSIVALCITIGQIITSSLAAYAFAFFHFRGKKVLFILILSTMMIPGEAIVISNYLTIGSWGLIDTYRGLIIPFLSSAMGIFLIRQFYLTVPMELKEASIIDGSTNLQFFTRILLPISRPVLGALGVYAFLSAWNQYMWPLLVTNSEHMRTVQIGISMLQSSEAQDYGIVMSGIILIILPSLFIFLFGQKQLIEGMTSGAVKG